MGMGIGGGGSVIKSIQRGYSQVNSVSFDVTISAINLSKSFISIGGTAYSSGNCYMPVARLTGSTTLRIEQVSGFDSTIGWEVIEYA